MSLLHVSPLCKSYLPPLDTVQDFFAQVGHQTMSAYIENKHVMVRPTKIMNNLLKVCQILYFQLYQYFFFEKKNPKWPFFKIANSQNFFVKISQVRPWVSRIA